MIGLGHYIVVAAVLFTFGVLGIFLNRRNVILMLMAIELILLAVNINLVAFSAYLGDLTGQVLAMFVLTVAAAARSQWTTSTGCTADGGSSSSSPLPFKGRDSGVGGSRAGSMPASEHLHGHRARSDATHPQPLP
jgi:NADH-quinone oxidoreductase subunit K